MSAPDIDPSTLLHVLVDDEARRALVERISRADGAEPWNTFASAATAVDATPDELTRVVEVLIATGHEDLATCFFVHPRFPEETLLSLADRGLCTHYLGHCRAPRRLLERMVDLHAYPEAVLSLGLVLYREPGESLAAFEAHARKHASHAWMLRTLAECDGSDLAKEELYESLLVDAPEAAAFHARHLARSERCDAARLERFVANADPRVLVLLLASDISDSAKRDLVVRLAEEREDDASVRLALAVRRAVDRAMSDTLTPKDATALVALALPDVLLALAGNPHTPRPILEHLKAHRGTKHARQIRTRAAESLRRRA